eukprot:NODE_1070_length_2342_cov_0.531431.p4 type:complete len:104 gc:universal NODE_1070_length_2342_cov_0.531431:1431-1742(+)
MTIPNHCHPKFHFLQSFRLDVRKLEGKLNASLRNLQFFLGHLLKNILFDKIVHSLPRMILSSKFFLNDLLVLPITLRYKKRHDSFYQCNCYLQCSVQLLFSLP